MASHIRRREMIVLLGGAAAWPLAAGAQQPERMRRVGLVIALPNDALIRGLIKAFREELGAQGWIEGKNVRFDERWVEGDATRIASLVADALGAAPDVILAAAPPALVALRQQTRTIPLVFVAVSDPVDGGFVESMARPGGNVTGFTSFEYSIGGKWLELLKEVRPSLKGVLVVLNQDNYTSRALLHTITALAPSIGVQIRPAPRAQLLRDRSEHHWICAGTRRSRLAAAGRSLDGSSRAHCGVGGCSPPPDDSLLPLFCHRRLPDVVWHRQSRPVSTSGLLCRPRPQGREAGRSAGAEPNQVRARDQPQDRKGARPRRAGNLACSRQRGDRIRCDLLRLLTSGYGTKRTFRRCLLFVRF